MKKKSKNQRKRKSQMKRNIRRKMKIKRMNQRDILGVGKSLDNNTLVTHFMRTPENVTLKEQVTLTDLRELPIELKTIVQTFLNQSNIHHGDCHFNSMKLSLFNPEIKRVSGFVGRVFRKGEKENLRLNNNLKLNLNGLYEINGDGNIYYDMENETVYFKHSWSEYNGIQFDITKYCETEMIKYKNEIIRKHNLTQQIQFDSELFYYPSFTVDLNKFKSTDVRYYLEKVIEMYPKYGIIMNRLFYNQNTHSFMMGTNVNNSVLI